MARVAHAEPLAEMNITPLIDVLLVLLVMLILTVPAMTHKVAIELPVGSTHDLSVPQVHRITIAPGGAIAWDGRTTSLAALPARLIAFEARPDAQLQIAADGASRYDVFDRVLAVVKRAGVTRLGFVGNERFARF
jgi:biopolymer transport protein ExbD